MNLTRNVIGCERFGRLALTGALLLLLSGCTGGLRMAGLRSLRNKPEDKQATEAKEESASFRRLFDREASPEKTAARTAPAAEPPGGVKLGGYTRNPNQAETTGGTQLASDRRLREKPAEVDPFLNVPPAKWPQTAEGTVARRETAPTSPTGNNQFVEGFDEKLKQLQQEVASAPSQGSPANQAAPFPDFDETPTAPSQPFPETAATQQSPPQPTPSQQQGVFRLGPPNTPSEPLPQTPGTPAFPPEIASGTPRSQAPAFPPEIASGTPRSQAPAFPPESQPAGPSRNPFQAGPVPGVQPTPNIPGVTTPFDSSFVQQKTPRQYPLEANGPSPDAFAPSDSRPVITSRNEYLNKQQEQFAWKQTDNRTPAPTVSRGKSIFPEGWESVTEREATPAATPGATAEFPDDIYPESVRQSVQLPQIAPQQAPSEERKIVNSPALPPQVESSRHFAKLNQGWQPTGASVIAVPDSEPPAPIQPTESLPPVQPAATRPTEFPAEPAQPELSSIPSAPAATVEPTPEPQLAAATDEWGDYNPETIQATPVEQLRLSVPLDESAAAANLESAQQPSSGLTAPAVVSLNPFEAEEPLAEELAVAPAIPQVSRRQELPIPQAELAFAPAKAEPTALPPAEPKATPKSESGSSLTPWFLGAVLLASAVGFLVRKRMQLQRLQSTPAQG